MKAKLITAALILAISSVASGAGTFGIVLPRAAIDAPGLVVNIECAVDECKSLSMTRAYNKKFCKTKDECLQWIGAQRICDAAAIDRCKARAKSGPRADGTFPGQRADGMDY
ncbi:MAG: hypothetical protein K9G60_05675 [Pseudolabrys sp.]|nr:hypothetical protein [Pseudolabrys sp.]